jgi:hypothetical protein
MSKWRAWLFFIFFSFLNIASLARFEILMAMFLEIQVFCGVMPCWLLCVWIRVFKSSIYMTPHVYSARLKSGLINFNTTLLLIQQISVSLQCTVKFRYNIPAVCVFCDYKLFLLTCLNSVFPGFMSVCGLHKNINCKCSNL